MEICTLDEIDIKKAKTFIEEEIREGQSVSVAMVQRAFQVGYRTAERALVELSVIGCLLKKEDRIVPYYQKPRNVSSC